MGPVESGCIKFCSLCLFLMFIWSFVGLCSALKINVSCYSSEKLVEQSPSLLWNTSNIYYHFSSPLCGDICSYLVGSQSSLVLNQVGAPAQTK